MSKGLGLLLFLFDSTVYVFISNILVFNGNIFECEAWRIESLLLLCPRLALSAKSSPLAVFFFFRALRVKYIYLDFHNIVFTLLPLLWCTKNIFGVSLATRSVEEAPRIIRQCWLFVIIRESHFNADYQTTFAHRYDVIWYSTRLWLLFIPSGTNYLSKIAPFLPEVPLGLTIYIRFVFASKHGNPLRWTQRNDFEITSAIHKFFSRRFGQMFNSAWGLPDYFTRPSVFWATYCQVLCFVAECILGNTILSALRTGQKSQKMD